MLKKLISLGVVSIISMSLMVGCSSSQRTKVDSSNTLTQVQDIIGSNYKVLEANLNDGSLVVKTQIDYSGNWDDLFKLNLHAIEDLAIDIDLSNINELEYWSVCQTTDGGTKKTFSCTVQKDQLQMMQDRKIFANEIDNMTSKMTDLYLDQELLLGLSHEIASQIIFNTKDTSATTESNDAQEPQQPNTKKDSSNTYKKHTQGDRGKNSTTTKKYDSIEEEIEHQDGYIKDGTHLGEQYNEQWCSVCQVWYNPDIETHNCQEQDNSGEQSIYNDNTIEDTQDYTEQDTLEE